jgi:hypothetical protein
MEDGAVKAFKWKKWTDESSAESGGLIHTSSVQSGVSRQCNRWL